ncbi:hypothetical protein HBI75_115580 [Parastagonospora nodorum]|nr:hypothetical protein HBI75_115580 [Parastagonospora nodorum]KAH5523708.1 hypothetical protein HBI29_034470 [Parastagonospora nodorum]KAH6232182.1 hypothetical protein HBI53_025070 [Parastagonospora nodorum]
MLEAKWHTTFARKITSWAKIECYKPVEQGDCDVCIKQIRSADAKPHEHGIEDEAEPGIKITAYGHVLGKECAIQWFEEVN